MKEYKLIYADPPWKYSDKSLHRGGAERHYSTEKTDDLKKLIVDGVPIQSLSAHDSVCAMWATSPLLPQALELLKAWGFTYKKILFVWVKTNRKSGSLFMGMGHYTRSNHELLILGVKGKGLPRLTRSIIDVVTLPVSFHSKKPDTFRELLLELFGDVPRIELFSRQTTPGWDVWGNEVPQSPGTD